MTKAGAPLFSSATPQSEAVRRRRSLTLSLACGAECRRRFEKSPRTVRQVVHIDDDECERSHEPSHLIDQRRGNARAAANQTQKRAWPNGGLILRRIRAPRCGDGLD